MIDSGSCDSNGYTMIGSKVECERAATDLGLLDTSATSFPTTGRPHGCIYADDDFLNWYSPGGPYPSASCGVERQHPYPIVYNCICLKGIYSSKNTRIRWF